MSAPARTSVLGLLAAFVSACAPAGDSSTTVDVAAEVTAIESISSGWMDLANARDAEGLASIFASDAQTFFDGEHSRGVDEIMERTREEWVANPDAVASWVTSRIEMAASGDLGVERGTWTGVDEDGEAETGEYVTVYRKIDGQWKVIIDAGTTLVDDQDDQDDDDG